MTYKAHSRAYKIAEALGGSLVPDASGNFMCCLPRARRADASLSIRDSDAGLLCHCFAGCGYADIMAALQKQGLLPEGVSIGADDINGATVEAASDIKIDGARRQAPEAVMAAEENDEAEEAAEDPAEAATKARAEGRQRSSPRGEPSLAASGRRSTPSQPCTRRSTPIATGAALRASRRRRHGFALPRAACMPAKIRTASGSISSFPCCSSPARTRRPASFMAGRASISPMAGAALPRSTRKERKKTESGTSLKGAVASIAEPVEGEFLLVGEGWATVRTVMDATGLPGWSVFGTSGLTSFDPPDTVKAILFLAENDADGKNAKALAVICPKLFERGIKIGVAKPPPGLSDFNELVRKRDDKTRLHGTVEAGLKVVSDIIEKAKTKAG